jgi:hypothetical protein
MNQTLPVAVVTTATPATETLIAKENHHPVWEDVHSTFSPWQSSLK